MAPCHHAGFPRKAFSKTLTESLMSFSPENHGRSFQREKNYLRRTWAGRLLPITRFLDSACKLVATAPGVLQSGTNFSVRSMHYSTG